MQSQGRACARGRSGGAAELRHDQPFGWYDQCVRRRRRPCSHGPGGVPGDSRCGQLCEFFDVGHPYGSRSETARTLPVREHEHLARLMPCHAQELVRPESLR